MTATRAQIIVEAGRELARRDFFEYAKLTASDFYKNDRQYLVDLCRDLQDFIEQDDHDVLVINLPPRLGKSRTATKFVEWIMGNDKSKKVMTGSYNETLSTTFSKAVRNAILEQKADENITVYNDIFPDVKIKHGDGAMNLWSLEGSYSNYLATSPGGTATGFGADYIVIDDLIKNAEEANNARILKGHWSWFTDTMLSRLESGGKIIIIMTRWHSNDLAGRALRELPRLDYAVKHINLKAKRDDGTMLCDDLLSAKEYERKRKAMSAEIASANYQQEPIDLKGRLYDGFKTYTSLPPFKRIDAYVDTADTGKDFLAAYIYGVTKDNDAYVLDIIYTRDAMEKTEPLLAKKLHEHKVNLAHIESNNGGRGFARAVERILKDVHKSNKTVIKPFHQSKNKQSRIYTSSAWVQEHVIFPDGWSIQWRELYESLMSYQREGKNTHDDAQDGIAGIYDKIEGRRRGFGWSD